MRRDGLGGAKSITDLAKRVEKSWEGGLILKNSLFPTKLLLTEGEMEVGRDWTMKLFFFHGIPLFLFNIHLGVLAGG